MPPYGFVERSIAGGNRDTKPLPTTIQRCSFVAGALRSMRSTLWGKQNQSPKVGWNTSDIAV